MIFEQLDLIAFGRFTDERLDFSDGGRQLHLVYGPNESGKSTCLRAIRGLLFGMPRSMNDDFVHPYKKLRVGATLRDSAGNALRLIRRKADRRSLYGADDRTPTDEAVLAELLGGIDEHAFMQRFGFSPDQLASGGEAVVKSHGDLGQLLFAAGAGVSRLQAIEQELRKQSEALFLNRGKKTINVLLKELETRKRELRELQAAPAEYDSLRAEQADAEQRSGEITREIADTRGRLAQLRNARDARTIVLTWKRQREQLATLAEVPLLDEHFAGKRREAAEKRNNHQMWVAQQGRRIAEIERQLATQVEDTPVLRHETDIVALFQAVAQRQEDEKKRESLSQSIAQHNRWLRQALRELGQQVAEDADQASLDAAIDRLSLSDAAQSRITELSRQYESTRQRDQEALKRLRSLRKQLDEVERELEQAPTRSDPSLIDSVLSEVGTPKLLCEPVDQQRRACRELEADCQRLAQQLGFGELSLNEAAAVTAPSIAEIDRFEQSLAERKQAVSDADKHVAHVRAKHHEVEQELARLAVDHPLPTQQELAEAREQRDACVDRLEADPPDQVARREQAEKLRRAIRQADTLVDTICLYHDQVARRDAANVEREQLEQEIESAQRQRHQAAAELEATEANWRELWNGLPIQVLEPREMRGWLSKHESLSEKVADLEKSRAALETAQQGLERAAGRLRSAVELALDARADVPEQSPAEQRRVAELEFAPLHDLATRLRKDLAADAERCRQLREKREAVRSELPNAEADHESQRGLWEQWQQQWQAAIGTFSGDRTASPVAINQQLKKIDAILDTRRDRDRDLQTLQELERAAALFVQRVRAIADAVAEPDEFASADQLACRLHERLLQSKQVQRERQRLHKERTQAIEECDESRRTLDQATVQLQQLCVEARVQTPDELPAVEERAAEKRRLRQAVSTAEDRLTELAAGESLENFNERVERWDPVELEAEIEQSEKRLQASEEQQQHFQQQLGALKTKLEAIDGGDRAAELNQQIQFLTGRIERETAQYARLKVASMILRRSIEHYRRANETPVLRLACEAFEALTCGRYSGLRPDFDDKGHSKLFGVERGRGGEELVPVELMSAGTQDAVFFALRLASLRHQLSSGRTIPVVIDDCLIQLDDRRAEAALREFGKLAETTQVILFTHHRHLLELAASALDPQRYQLHRLSAPVSAAER